MSSSSGFEPCESQLFFVDNSVQVIEEFDDYLPQLPLVHIKLPKKPSARGAVSQAKFLIDAAHLVREWLGR